MTPSIPGVSRNVDHRERAKALGVVPLPDDQPITVSVLQANLYDNIFKHINATPTVMQARSNLLAFTEFVYPPYKADAFHEDMALWLDKVVSGEVMNLIIEAPPQHGKSMLVSHHLPSYWLAKNPDDPVLLTSYAADKAHDNSRRARGVLQTQQWTELFPTVVGDDPGHWRAHDWGIKGNRGYVFAAGVGGPVTGHGFRLGLIDDPFENWEKAQSETTRRTVWEWWQGTFITRIWEHGRIVIIMCLTGDTPITMGDGSRSQLSDVKVGDSVMAWQVGRQVKRRVLRHASQGEDDVLEIRTGNHRVRANARHPFLAAEPDGNLRWIRAADLRRGHRLVCSGQQHGSQATDRISTDEAWLLGFMFGDGWVTRNKKRSWDSAHRKSYPTSSLITCCAVGIYPDRNAKVMSLFQSLFGIKPRLTPGRYLRTDVQRVGRFFVEHGLSGKAKTKRLPNWLFGQSLAARSSFLDGFVNADGYIDKRGRVIICLCNERLVVDLRHLARSVGLNPSNINRYEYTARPPNSKRETKAVNINVQWNQGVVSAPFRLATVRSVRPAGRAEVFDIQVEGSETFLADGLVVHNTRWHEDDLVGRILEEEGTVEHGGRWVVKRYPALIDNQKDADEDPLGRDIGEPLAPTRFSAAFLESVKTRVGPMVWNAEYQQRPTRPEGDFFKIGRVRIESTPPADICKMVQVDANAPGSPYEVRRGIRFWDLAATAVSRASRDPDYTVGTLVAEDKDGMWWVLDVVRTRMDPEQVQDVVYQTTKLDGKRVKQVVEQEPGAAGKTMIANYIRILAGYPCEGKSHAGDKAAWADGWAGQVNAGNVILLAAPWNKPWLAEHAGFPNAKHDDQVDSAAGAFNVAVEGERQFKHMKFLKV